MTGESEKKEGCEKTLGVIGTIAFYASLLGGLIWSMDYYRKKAEIERKAPIESIEQANKSIEGVITRLEGNNDFFEQRAKDKLRKFLALVGVSEDEEVEYFHKIMQDEKERAVFRNYVEECVSNNTKPCKDGFRRYLARDGF
ncbi:MAG: hypothetical protein QXR48_02225 [Candidatus Woesearchaeota archaeon]